MKPFGRGLVVGATIGVLMGFVVGALVGKTAATGATSNSDASEPRVATSTPGVSESPTQGATPLQEVMANIFLYPDIPNSAGGVDVSACFQNASEKAIKYVVFTVTPYNAVDDPISSEIGGKTSARLKYTGPLPGGARDAAFWETVWYNGTFHHVVLDAIDVEYMDGTTVSVPVVTQEFQVGGSGILNANQCATQ